MSNAPYEAIAPLDFEVFARGLIIPAATGPTMFDNCIAPFQLETFRALAPSLKAIRDGCRPSKKRFWIERTKKASKDGDMAVVLLWLMAYPVRPFFAQVVAANREQAGIIRRRTEDILHYNPWLKGLVETPRSMIRSKNPHLGKTVIEPTDKLGAHGETPDLLILNELVHVAKWSAMEVHMNNLAGVPRGVGIVCTNAGYRGTKAEIWRENAVANPDRWSVHLWSKPAPWTTAEDREEVKAITTQSDYRRLWYGEWPSGLGDGFSEEAIDGCFRDYLNPLRGPEEGWLYIAGLDLGIKHDYSALVIVGIHWGQQRIKVVYIREWVPSIVNDKGVKEVDIEDVETACKRKSERFNVTWFGYDPAAGGSFLAQRLRKAGVKMVEVLFTGAGLTAMAVALKQVIESGRLECFVDSRLRRDLGKFDIVPLKPSGYRLKAISDEHGHADVGTALAICLPEAKRILGWSSGLDPGGELATCGEEELNEEEVDAMDPFLRDIYDDEVEYQEENRIRKSDWGDI